MSHSLWRVQVQNIEPLSSKPTIPPPAPGLCLGSPPRHLGLYDLLLWKQAADMSRGSVRRHGQPQQLQSRGSDGLTGLLNVYGERVSPSSLFPT